MMDFGCGIIFAHVAPPVDWSKSSSIWLLSLAPELIGRAVPQLKTTHRLFQRLELIRNWRAKCWSALSTRPSDNSRRYFVLISSFIRPFLPFFASEINYAIGFLSFSYSMPSIELLSNCWLRSSHFRNKNAFMHKNDLINFLVAYDLIYFISKQINAHWQ